MKVIIELITIGCLIWAGWNQSFSDHVRRVAPNAIAARRPTPPRSELPKKAVEPAATPQPRDTSWLWQRGTLDPPIRR